MAAWCALCAAGRGGRSILLDFGGSPVFPLNNTPRNAWCGPRKCKGQSAFSQCFSRAKGAALGGLEAHLLCLGRGVAPAAADLAGAGLTEHGGGGGSRWSGALKRV